MLRRRTDIMKDGAVGFFGVDQIKNLVQELLITLPQDQASPETLKKTLSEIIPEST